MAGRYTMGPRRTVGASRFSMIPRADIPRSVFHSRHAHKTTFDAGFLIPIYADEVLPGDSFRLKMTAFCRMATPLYPVMDNLYLDSFFFFVPNRLLWDNWQRFMGEQPNPDDTTDFVIPTVSNPVGVGFNPGGMFDYFGIPTNVGPASGASINALHARAYNLIWNEWFRDQNLQVAAPVPTDDGPDPTDGGQYVLRRRGKRHDYFTSALPWPQKGEAVTLPLGGTAPVLPDGTTGPTFFPSGVPAPAAGKLLVADWVQATGEGPVRMSGTQGTWPDFASLYWQDPALHVDLSQATAQTINALRSAFQIQKLLERDARGGTRYTEIILSHFGVRSPDSRLQRPEYLGGGTTAVNVNPVAQTVANAPNEALGDLGGVATAVAADHGFNASFTEHGVLLGFVNIRADLTYQQGLRKMWTRRTRYDFYWPVFSHLGEQAVLNHEIYWSDDVAANAAVFGYQERWAEYRYKPSLISGRFRSSDPATLDAWHLAQQFGALPTLGPSFIEERPPVGRVLAVQDAATHQQFLFDSLFDIRAVRPMPAYSVPGLVDHF